MITGDVVIKKDGGQEMILISEKKGNTICALYNKDEEKFNFINVDLEDLKKSESNLHVDVEIS